MKKNMIRITTQFLSVVIVSLLISNISIISYAETKTVSLVFNGKSRKFDWSLDYFNKNATEYNHNLALAGLVLSNAIYDEKSGGASEALRTLEFKHCESNYPKANDWTKSADRVAYAFAYNEKSKVVAVVLRGTPPVSDWDIPEWYSNVTNRIGDGYSNATLQVRLALQEYLKYLREECGLRTDGVKYFITGHSRGGAVANLLGVDLMATDDSKAIEKVFVYAFATPNCTDDIRRNTYINIFNICNSNDKMINGNLTKKLTGEYRQGRIYSAAYGEKLSNYEHKTQRYLSLLDSHRVKIENYFNGNKATTLTLNAKTVALEVGETKKIKATTNSKNSVTWKTNNNKVAVVDKNGIITAKSEGKATITASVDDSRIAVSVEVKKLSESVLWTIVKDDNDYRVIGIFPKGKSAADIKYKSLNTKVATIDKNGNITLVNRDYDGSCEISVTYNNKTENLHMGIASGKDGAWIDSRKLDYKYNGYNYYGSSILGDNHGIYRVKAGEKTGVQIRKENARVTVVYVNDDYICYTLSDADGMALGDLYRIKHNGDGKGKVNSEKYDGFRIVDDNVYFYSGDDYNGYDSLYKININGKVKTKILTEKINGFEVSGNWVIYHKNNEKDGWLIDRTLYRVKNDGKDKSKLYNISGGYKTEGNWIYYVNENSLYKIKNDNTGKKLLVKDEAGTIYDIKNNWVFYGRQNSYFKIRTDGIGKRELTWEQYYKEIDA